MTSFSLKFKGSRNYLQGGDIFNALEVKFGSKESGYLSKLVFKRFSRRQFDVLNKLPVDSSQIFGNGVWTSLCGKCKRFWLEETASEVTESYPFDENKIISDAIISKNLIQLSSLNSYSTIENIISLTKKLNYILEPEYNGKWLFGQIDLKQRLPNQWTCITIERTVCVGIRFSRNVITIDNQFYGEIRFVGGRQ